MLHGSESLPGDPTEADPDNRTQAIADKNWHDLMTYAKEDVQFGLVRFGAKTKYDRSMLREHIAKAQEMLHDADVILRGMEAPWSR
jgi:hypothetical protein